MECIHDLAKRPLSLKMQSNKLVGSFIFSSHALTTNDLVIKFIEIFIIDDCIWRSIYQMVESPPIKPYMITILIYVP